jgi:hypothetical protein
MSHSNEQVSEGSGMGDEPEPIAPEDAVAGAPDGESGEAQEGTTGPDASPREGRPGTEPRPDTD